ncbi:MAG TPA: CocE/NonD family hydrolase C-terminal non-catalytic domain-containing protein, partial [Povalibacter sp.]
YNAGANHFLIVGPYDHGATASPYKPPTVKGYAIDPLAQLDSVALTYNWFDHVMRGGPKPALLQDRVNYEVMGANLWRHAPSIERMGNRTLTLYLTDTKIDDHYFLGHERPTKVGFLEQVVDFADRTTQNNLYPVRAIEEKVELTNGFKFVSEPFEEPVSFDGQLSGELNVTISKRDMDVTLSLYELTADAKWFNLSYYLARASYANDMTRRELLKPGKKATIPFDRTPLMSRQMARGSRLVLLLTVSKNSHAQINYGSGKDVSDESIEDAKTPLRVRWHTDSFVKVPLGTSPAAGT